MTARTEAELVGLESENFVAAVTGHAESRPVADAVIAARHGSDRCVRASPRCRRFEVASYY